MAFYLCKFKCLQKSWLISSCFRILLKHTCIFSASRSVQMSDDFKVCKCRSKFTIVEKNCILIELDVWSECLLATQTQNLKTTFKKGPH